MMHSKQIILILSLTIITSHTAFSQWNKGKGNGYYKLSAWYLEADEHYTDTGKIDPNVTRSQFNVSFYGEYGISNKLDGIAYIPFFSRAVSFDDISGATGKIINEGEALNDMGDIELGIRYGLVKTNNYALSISLKLGIPTGNNSGGSDGSFQTGDGEFNQLFLTNLGTSFHVGIVPFYTKTYIGFNNRTEDFSDELRGGLELGANVLRNKLWLLSRVDILQSFKNGSLNAQTAQGSIFANNIEFINLGAEASYYISDTIGVSLQFTSIVSGELIYAGTSYTGGLFLDIK